MQRKLMAVMIPLAALCLFAPVTVAKADTEINTYAVDGSYTVNIPADVNIEEATNKGTLSMTGELDACYNLEIKISSDTDYYLLNTDNSKWKLKYKLSEDSVVFSKEEGSTDKVISQYDVGIRVKDTPVVSGEYKDILKFEIKAKNYQEEKKHKLIFNKNCTDDVVISTSEKFVNENVEYGMLPVPKRTGYTFAGWYTESGTQVDETTIMKSTDMTVYAHWKANVLTINYHSGGAQQWKQYPGDQVINITGNDEVVKTETIAYNVQYDHAMFGLLDVERLTRKGYHTGHKWKIGSPDSDAFVTDTNITDYTNFTGKDVAELIAHGILDQLVSGDVTVELYPVFVANTYTVQYVANAEGDEVSGEPKSTSQTYDKEFALPENWFVREGWTFEGWVWIDPDDESNHILCKEGELLKNLTEKNGETVVLYARWKKNSTSDSSSETTIQENNDAGRNIMPESEEEGSTSTNELSSDTETDTVQVEDIRSDYSFEQNENEVAMESVTETEEEKSQEEIPSEEYNMEVLEEIKESDTTITEAETQEATATD